MDVTAADGTADLRIDRAQVAMLVVWQRLVLRLFGQRMRNAVVDRALLGEQQGEYKQQRQKQAERSHDSCTLTKLRRYGKQLNGVQNILSANAVTAAQCE